MYVLRLGLSIPLALIAGAAPPLALTLKTQATISCFHDCERHAVSTVCDESEVEEKFELQGHDLRQEYSQQLRERLSP